MIAEKTSLVLTFRVGYHFCLLQSVLNPLLLGFLRAVLRVDLRLLFIEHTSIHFIIIYLSSPCDSDHRTALHMCEAADNYLTGAATNIRSSTLFCCQLNV